METELVEELQEVSRLKASNAVMETELAEEVSRLKASNAVMETELAEMAAELAEEV